MARFDYYGLMETIKNILDRDPSLDDEDGGRPQVLIEEELSFTGGDIIIIALQNREADDNDQTLSAGKRVRYQVEIGVWCYAYSLDRQNALKRRDDLLGKVETVLMNNRQFDSFAGVNMSWPQGGRFQNFQDEESMAQFLSGAEITLITDVTVTAP